MCVWNACLRTIETDIPCAASLCLPDATYAALFAAAALLERILELLLGFVQRTHQSLAAVGVAALVRLIVASGPNLDERTWMMVRWAEGVQGWVCRSAVLGCRVRKRFLEGTA